MKDTQVEMLQFYSTALVNVVNLEQSRSNKHKVVINIKTSNIYRNAE